MNKNVFNKTRALKKLIATKDVMQIDFFKFSNLTQDRFLNIKSEFF